jgi:hypothetical protein
MIGSFGWHSKLLDATLTFERKKEQTAAAAWDRWRRRRINQQLAGSECTVRHG